MGAVGAGVGLLLLNGGIFCIPCAAISLALGGIVSATILDRKQSIEKNQDKKNTLSDFNIKKHLTLNACHNIALKLLKYVDSMHKENIYYRSIKKDNIILDLNKDDVSICGCGSAHKEEKSEKELAIRDIQDLRTVLVDLYQYNGVIPPIILDSKSQDADALQNAIERLAELVAQSATMNCEY